MVSEKFRRPVMEMLHETNSGTIRMKALGRWPGFDKQLKDLAKSCSVCRISTTEPARNRDGDGVWPCPPNPWHRLHIDYAGPVDGKYLLILVDATSRWPEIFATNSTKSQSTIGLLQSVFARFGAQVELVSDKGP